MSAKLQIWFGDISFSSTAKNMLCLHILWGKESSKWTKILLLEKFRDLCHIFPKNFEIMQLAHFICKLLQTSHKYRCWGNSTMDISMKNIQKPACLYFGEIQIQIIQRYINFGKSRYMSYFPNTKIQVAKNFPNTNRKLNLFLMWQKLVSDLKESLILGKLK